VSLSYTDLCRQATLTRAMVDRFLDESAHNYAAFDPVLGYRLRDCIVRDGVDGANVVYRYEAGGERKRIAYADRPCRLNTYGDSFTQCHQVSDGETWQEVLAAHLGEPIRNYGVGGYGVYQAYRRLLGVEEGSQAAPYLLLNIFSDDHLRNLLRWRWLVIPGYWGVVPRDGGDLAVASMLHANPWAHLAYDPEAQVFVERPSVCPTRASLTNLCDADWVVATFRDDWVAQAVHITQGGTGYDVALLARYAEALGVEPRLEDEEAVRETATRALRRCALASTRWILERLVAWADEHGRRLMVALSYGEGDVLAALEGRPLADRALLATLDALGLPRFDSLAAHVEDYQAFAIPPQAYVRRYYIGHYSPTGNHYVAHALKPDLVRWLDPPPLAYRAGSASLTEITGELA